ncbi:MAG: hypothetical protein LAO20_17910 [Acidobacteriia bacterium]|nr:hypothetical protein [Terriglobia bacterium]
MRAPLKMLVGICVAAIAITAFAADPWKDKEYKAWTMEDVQKILFDSPWVKMVEVGAPWLKGSTHFLTPLPVDCNGRPEWGKGDRTPSSWATGATESIVIFQVTWQSSRTVRAAKFRQSSLCGRVDPEKGDDLLEDTPDDYIIIVNSPDMTPFEGLDEDGLIKITNLVDPKTQKKIAPESVLIAKYGGRTTPYQLTFKFPRKTAAGEPAIPADEKEIEFFSQAGKVKLKAKFQLSKMTGKNGPDL